MPLTVTPGSSFADSYASVADCDAYHSALGNSVWTGTTQAKEEALRRATIWLDARYRARWTGLPTNNRDQSLDWPRLDVYDVDGYEVNSLIIPREIVKATCEAALRELQAPGSLAPDIVPGTVKVLTGVGDITWTPLRNGASASEMVPLVVSIDNALSGLIRIGSNLVMRA